MKIASIQIANRHRKSLGDVKSLAESMKDVGLLQPVVVDQSGKLIAGERRLAAAALLGWTEIEVKVAGNLNDIAVALKAERDENKCREPFTPTEAASLAESLEPFERKAAAMRKSASLKCGDSSEISRAGNLPAREKGGAVDKVAEAFSEIADLIESSPDGLFVDEDAFNLDHRIREEADGDAMAGDRFE